MSLLKKYLGKRRESLAFRIDGKPPTDPAIAHWLTGGRESTAGSHVSEDKALSLSAVFAAVNLLSSVIAALPLHVMRKAGKKREVAENHPADKVLHTRANEEMTAFQARRCLEWNRLLWGRAAAEVGYDAGGNVRALWPVEGYRVAPCRDMEGDLYYTVDGSRRVAPADMVYIPLISDDGVCGRSFLDYAVESLGLSISAQEFAARFFGNGARPGGLLINEQNVKKEAREELRESWHRTHGGPGGSHKVGVLWGGWKYDRSAGAIAPEEAQLLETRRFATEEVARWFGIPPHMLAELSRATFSNIEEQGINFVTYCLGPILTAYEQEYDGKLLDPPKLYAKHNLGGLMRGNSAARSAFYTAMRNIGVLNANEIRELEDWNPIGEAGDVYLVPANMLSADDLLDDEEEEEPPAPALPVPVPPASGQPPTETPPEGENGDGEAKGGPANEEEKDKEEEEMRRQILRSTYVRMLRVETNAIRRAAKRPAEFLAWIDGYYPDHAERLAEALTPAVALFVGAKRAIADAVRVAANSEAASREWLLDMAGRATHATLSATVERNLEIWEATRPDAVVSYVTGVLNAATNGR